MAFENGVVPEDWRSTVIVELYRSKENRTECKNYRGISKLNVVGKRYAGILIDEDRGVSCLLGCSYGYMNI